MEKKYTIIEDPVYKYLRVEPIPIQEEVNKFYLEEFYSTEYKSFNDSSLEIQQEEKDFFDSRWEDICLKIKNYFEKLEGISLFDIGFGYAQALLYFKNKGIIVSGLEPSNEGVEYAKKEGLEVYQADIEDFDCVGSNRYDVVTLINVLEHLRLPAETLINIKKKLLTNHGLLVIDVPNDFNDFQVIANEEYKLKQWWVCPPNHINYFSNETLKNLLDQCGYKVVLCENTFPLEIFMLMGDVYVGNSSLGRECHLKRVKFERLIRKYGKQEKLSKLYQGLAELNLGRQIVAYATPKI